MVSFLFSPQNDYKDDRLLQKVTFLKAILTYNAGDYPKAGAYFRRAVKNDKVKALTAQSLFWLAQLITNAINLRMLLMDFFVLKTM